MLFCRPRLQPVVIWVLVASQWSPACLSILTSDPQHQQGIFLCTQTVQLIFPLSGTVLCEAQWWTWCGENPTRSAGWSGLSKTLQLVWHQQPRSPAFEVTSVPFLPHSDAPVRTFSKLASPTPSRRKCFKLSIGRLDICVQTSGCA